MRFAGPFAKVRRARRQQDALQRSIDLFFRKSNHFRIATGRVDPVTSRAPLVAYEVGKHRAIPEVWSVIFGEVLHDLRSALDQAVCELAIEAHPGTSAEDWGRTNFPIFPKSSRAKTKRGPSGRIAFSCTTADIDPLTTAAKKVIERSQSYTEKRGYRRSPLWWLHELNNRDKHRAIPLVQTIPWGSVINFEAPVGHEPDYTIDFRRTLRDGSVLGTLVVPTSPPPSWVSQVGGTSLLNLACPSGDASTP